MRILAMIAILFIIIGLLLFSFPTISNFVYEKKVEKKQKEFIVRIEENKDILEQLYCELKNRNQELYENSQKNLIEPFSYEQVSIDLSKYGILDNIIGFIRIPKMNIELPILLGANSENMKNGAVHLTETSYPIGGENTNSVIAAHRGYGKAVMFRNIENLEIDDEIYIRNFREELMYKVSKIKIINPEEIGELAIQKDKEIITLITCHPYRVNTQRYIVKATREN